MTQVTPLRICITWPETCITWPETSSSPCMMKRVPLSQVPMRVVQVFPPKPHKRVSPCEKEGHGAACPPPQISFSWWVSW